MGKIEKLSELEHGLKVLLLALLPFVLTVGVIAGTINLFIGGVLASSVVYQLAWSLVQALSIDVVFFTAIALVFKVPRWGKLPYAAIVLVYGYALYTSIQIAGLQELNGASVQSAMSSLGVSMVGFTQIRSVAVLVTMIVLVPIQGAAKRYLITSAPPIKIGVSTQIYEDTQRIARPGSNEYQVSHRVQEGIATSIAGIPLVPERIAVGTGGIYAGIPQSTDGIAEQDGIPVRDIPEAIRGIPEQEQGIPNEQQRIDEGIPVQAPTDSGIPVGDALYEKVYRAYTDLMSKGEKVTAERIREVSGVGLVNSKKYLAIIRNA